MTSKPPYVLSHNVDFEELCGMHVVLIGNPLEGFTIYGPFKTGEDAVRWADDEVDESEDWFTAKLHAPNEEG